MESHNAVRLLFGIIVRSSVAYLLFLSFAIILISILAHKNRFFQENNGGVISNVGDHLVFLVQLLLFVVSAILAYKRAQHDRKLWKKMRRKCKK